MKLCSVTAIIVVMLVLASIQPVAAETEYPVEVQQLSFLAENLVNLGYIPGGALRILLSAHSGWTGMYPSINIIGDSPSDISYFISENPNEHVYYGVSQSCFPNGTKILILAHSPFCIPEGITSTADLSDTLNFTLIGYDDLSEPAAALLTPEIEIVELSPDTLGRFLFATETRGIYWFEVMQNTKNGPSVAFLFPIICGGDINDVLSGDFLSDSKVSSKQDILDELNTFRISKDLLPLIESSFLDSIAQVRATDLALTGSSEHYSDDGNGVNTLLPDSISVFFGENIARGSGFNVTWEMILISPFHLQMCLNPDLTEFGSAGAVDSQPYEWQLVYVQVFTGTEMEQ